MTEPEAIHYIDVFAQTDKHPTLDTLEIEACLLPYVEDDGTYTVENVSRAVADAWDVKVAKAADHHDVSVNGRTLSAQQVKANCEERARWYRRRLAVHVA